jgi:hypothetical protein
MTPSTLIASDPDFWQQDTVPDLLCRFDTVLFSTILAINPCRRKPRKVAPKNEMCRVWVDLCLLIIVVYHDDLDGPQRIFLENEY